MVQRQDPPGPSRSWRPRSGVPQTRLYHHVELLLERDLIRPVERRVVSGIIETRYRVVASARSSSTAGCSPATDEARREVLHDTLVAVFDTARDEIEASDPDSG